MENSKHSSTHQIGVETSAQEHTSVTTDQTYLDHLSLRTLRQSHPLQNKCVAEAIGTLFLVFFGVGAFCNASLVQKNVPLWHITFVFGLAVTLAVMAAALISGAHLNPAVSPRLLLFRPTDFLLRHLLAY